MISIIMGTYNGEAYLDEQIESILNQTYKDWKLYIFDDGSKDRTEEIARKYMDFCPDKIFFFKNKTNFGAKGNFFQGLGRVFRELSPESDYYAFSDQDDFWYEDKLSLVLSKMRETEGKERLPSAVFSDVCLTDRKLKPKSSSYFRAAGIDEKKVDLASLLMENKAIGGTMLLNKALVQKEAKAEEMWGSLPKSAKMHDWWFMLLAASLGLIGFVKTPTEAYRQHETNVVGGESFLGYVKKRLFGFSEIKKRLAENIEQGEAFLQYFEKELTKKDKEIIKDFASIKEGGFLRKRILLVKHGFYKSGLVRNFALFLFI